MKIKNIALHSPLSAEKLNERIEAVSWCRAGLQIHRFLLYICIIFCRNFDLLFRLSEMWDSNNSIAVGFRLSFLLAFGLKANFQVLSDSWFGARRGSSYYDWLMVQKRSWIWIWQRCHCTHSLLEHGRWGMQTSQRSAQATLEVERTFPMGL